MVPVFIGGHPRSGTTLLGAMLGAHRECICTPESPFKARVFRNLRKGGINTIDIQTAFEMIRNSWRFKLWGLPIQPVPYDEISSYQELILWLVKSYAKKTGKPESTFWIDHTPANIEHADTLIKLFPDSRLLHIIRDGRAVAASIMHLDWGANTIDRAAHSWVRKVSHYVGVESSLGAERIMQIKFEELIQEPESTLKNICRFINIDFQSHMVTGSGFKVPKYTVQQHSLLGKKLDVKRVSAWEKDLTPRQIEIFESIAGGLLQSLGYPLKYGLNARGMTVTEKIVSGAREVYMRKVVNKFRRRKRKSKGITTAPKN